MAMYSEQPQRDSHLSTAPRSFVEMLRQLPSQYKQVLIHPSPLTFATEMGKATWSSVWFQLISVWHFFRPSWPLLESSTPHTR